MKIKSLIIDDELNNVKNLSLILNKYCPDIELVASAYSANEGISKIEIYNPDLVFLDIQMPGKTAFEMLNELPLINFEIIFTTAHNDFAIKAMKFSAIDYLLKPIDISELELAIKRAKQRIELKVKNERLENFVELLKSGRTEADQRIALSTLRETRFVKTGDVVRFESSNNYTTVFLNNNESILVCKPIYEYENLLDGYGFLRCHQSHIVNKTYIKSWVKELGGYLVLTNGKEVPVSRNKRNLLNQFMLS